MHPLLVKIGPIPIHSYGALIALGFISGLLLVRRLSKASGLNVDRVMDITFWSLLVGFVGARGLFVLTRWESYWADPASIFKVWEGGLVFFGGPLLVIPFLIFALRKFELPFWKTADVLTPGLVVAHMFGRLGCLAAGCCYGKPTGTSFGVRLTSDLVEPELRGIPLHPTQLYESASLLILLLGLLWVYRRRQFDGQVVLTYLLAYPLIRSVIEIYRGDTIRGFLIDGILSTSQFISILVFAGALGFLILRLKRVKQIHEGNPR